MSRVVVFFGLLVLLFGSLSVEAQETVGVAVHPLENRASLTDDEINILSAAVGEVFLARSSSSVNVTVLAREDDCDAQCRLKRLPDDGVSNLVSGAVVSFGGQFVVQLEAWDVAAGTLVRSLSSAPVPSVVDLLLAAKTLFGEIASEILSASSSSRRETVARMHPVPLRDGPEEQPREPGRRSSGEEDHGASSGGVQISSEPSGAEIEIGGRLVGTTPSLKQLEQGEYSVTVYKEGYGRSTRVVTVLIGETKNLHFELDRYGYLLAYGHGAFWPGFLAFGLGGGLLIANPDSLEAPLVLGITGAVLMATGITLWVVRKRKMERETKSEPWGGFALLPTREKGISLGYARTF